MPESVDPATGKRIAVYEETTPAEIEAALSAANAAFEVWRSVTFDERARRMRDAAEVLRSRQEELAVLATAEMGKPIRESRAEVEKSAWACDYFAGHAEAFLAPEAVETDARRSRVEYRPFGVILAVMPWNYPYWQLFRFAAPGLMAGNACVLKHASNVTGSALAIEEVFREAGFPDGLFRTLVVGSRTVPQLIAHPLVRGVTLTGSTAAGVSVARAAGAAVKKSVLELGGSDPYLILEDADLDLAAGSCATGRLLNAGQSCISPKRLIVVEAVAGEFERRLAASVAEKRVGDPMDERTDVGPMARTDLRDEVHDQVRRSIDAGAVCLLGGVVPDRPGAWYPPTVLTGVRPGMAVFDEEVFGPVVSVIRAADEEDAIRLANASSFGLGAAVFTRDIERGERIAAERLDAGCCFVNAFVRSDPRLPFGGVKQSGYGRELSAAGIREFVNIKTVYVA